MEAITANLANVDTPGYKRMTTGTRSFYVPGSNGKETALYTHSAADWTQGALKPSASPYHMALMGEGFFAVEGEEGEMFTRSGIFQVDDKGTLMTAEGYPVAWENKTGPIDPTGVQIEVDGSGRVFQGEIDLGTLKVTNVAKPEQLEFMGGGYYKPGAATAEVPHEAVVYQSQLESSNVTSIDELVGMIAVQRSFESAKNVMGLIDQSYGRLTQIR
jgi:flagellar basal-body rod protein FlgF